MILYIMTFLIILCYGFCLYILKRIGALTSSDFINNITIFVGWIVALLIAWIHLQKTRRDNQLAKKDEIKKTLEINAFREINKAVSDFSSVISDLSIPFLTLPGKLKLHIESPLIFKFNKMEIDLSLRKQDTVLYSGTANFIRVIESNEIAVIEFDHYRKYIQLRVDDVHETTKGFFDYFSNIPIATLATQGGYVDFERRCHEIDEQLMNIQTYLFDYRIELMNSILEEIFDKKVPERRPRDPRYKTLKELAIREEVERESEERDVKAMNQDKSKEGGA